MGLQARHDREQEEARRIASAAAAREPAAEAQAEAAAKENTAVQGHTHDGAAMPTSVATARPMRYQRQQTAHVARHSEGQTTCAAGGEALQALPCAEVGRAFQTALEWLSKPQLGCLLPAHSIGYIDMARQALHALVGDIPDYSAAQGLLAAPSASATESTHSLIDTPVHDVPLLGQEPHDDATPGAPVAAKPEVSDPGSCPADPGQPKGCLGCRRVAQYASHWRRL